MSDAFRIECETADPRAGIVRVHGHLDPHSAPALAEECRRLRQAGRNLVLNLAGITFLSSSGIGVLLVLVEEFRQAGLTIRMAEVSPAAESVIRVLNLGPFLDIRSTERDALDATEAA